MAMEDKEEGAIVKLGTAEDRGLGGKSKKPKRSVPTPYSRPQPLLSKLVNPVRHLIVGFPILASKVPFKFGQQVETLPFHELHEPREANSQIEDAVLPVTKIEEPYQRESNFSSVSQLVSQRTFSREEAERLIRILNSQQVELPTNNHEPIVTVTNEDTNGSPSPIDIAKAFMKNRSSNASVCSHRSPPSRSPDTTTRWPGASSLHYAETPVKRTPIRGHISERTPYVRYNNTKNGTIASKRNETRFGSGPIRGIKGRKGQAESFSLYEPTRQSVGVPTHSSQLARRILEHLDRNPPTPKEKFNEFKFAVSGEHNFPDNSRFGKVLDAPAAERISSVDIQKKVIGSASEKITVTGNKRMLPPISVGFTFPVALASDLPTPSLAPSLKSVPSVESVPISYEFGTGSSCPDFSFPSVSLPPDFDSMNLKFSFGSNRSSNLSFSFPHVTVSS